MEALLGLKELALCALNVTLHGSGPGQFLAKEPLGEGRRV